MDVRAALLDILSELGRPLEADWPGDRPLELESLEVVLLHEELEERFGIRVPARDVTPAAFSTLNNLEALVRRLAEATA